MSKYIRPVGPDEIEEVFGVRPPGAPGMSRAQHLQWAKERALEYVDAGDTVNALGSLLSDLNKHPELRSHPGIELGLMLALTNNLNTTDEVRKHIEGFN